MVSVLDWNTKRKWSPPRKLRLRCHLNGGMSFANLQLCLGPINKSRSRFLLLCVCVCVRVCVRARLRCTLNSPIPNERIFVTRKKQFIRSDRSSSLWCGGLEHKIACLSCTDRPFNVYLCRAVEEMILQKTS